MLAEVDAVPVVAVEEEGGAGMPVAVGAPNPEESDIGTITAGMENLGTAEEKKEEKKEEEEEATGSDTV